MDYEAMWKDMIEIEPTLDFLYQKAKRLGEQGVQKPSDCANVVWYGHGNMKRQMSQYVGYEARDPRLATHHHYDCAYQKIYDALPDCNENCDGTEDDDD